MPAAVMQKLALVLALLSGLAGDHFLPRHILRIICIGDSITQGGRLAGEFTYRYPLQQLLTQAGYTFDFIGSRKSGLHDQFKWPGHFDPDHEGYYGATSAEVRQRLHEHLPTLAKPDIAIIHLSTNDKIVSRQTVYEPLAQMILELRQQNHHIHILLIQIPTQENDARNRLIRALAQQLNQPSARVDTLALYQHWHKEADTFDGAHPNTKGQYLMAQLIFNQIGADFAQRY